MKIYMIGIKGSGMSALAILLKKEGNEVCGLDVNDYIYTENKLRKNKIAVFDSQNKDYLDGRYFVIIGHNFFKKELIKKLQKNNILFCEYHLFISKHLLNRNLISISGSHGKTTLTKMLNSALPQSSALIGDGEGIYCTKENYFFLESCEYQNHFLVYNPKFIIITNIDYDHVDYFKTEDEYRNSFSKFSSKSNKGLIHYNDRDKIKNHKFFTFGTNPKADFNVRHYYINKKGIKGDLYFGNNFIISFSFNNLYGKALLIDVIATLSFAYLNNEDLNEVLNNLSNFKMANKRFNITYLSNNNILINDYAHHPSQIKENLETLRLTYPNYRYIAFFKPDRETRLIHFKQMFINVLSSFDEAYLIDYDDLRFNNLFQSMITNTLQILKKDELSKLNLFKDQTNIVFILMSSKGLETIENIFIHKKNSK